MTAKTSSPSFTCHLYGASVQCRRHETPFIVVISSAPHARSAVNSRLLTTFIGHPARDQEIRRSGQGSRFVNIDVTRGRNEGNRDDRERDTRHHVKRGSKRRTGDLDKPCHYELTKAAEQHDRDVVRNR